MVAALISALAVFVSTSIDYLVILTIVFAQARNKKNIGHVIGGQYLGGAILVAVSLIASFVLHFIPEEWITGLLGIVPIILGIRVAVKGEDEDENGEEDEESKLKEKLETRKSSRLFWTIALITIASGGDNLGVYIPYFTSLSVSEIIVAVIIFAVAILVLCYIGYKLSTIRFISKILEKYERIVVPIVYIALGIFIMAESGIFAKLLQFLDI